MASGIQEGDLLMTLLVVTWIQKFYPGVGKVSLILNKAISYIKKQGITDHKDIVAKLMDFVN